MIFKNDNPIVDLNRIEIPVKAVLRRLGYPRNVQSISGEAGEIFRDVLNMAVSLLHPKGIFKTLEIKSVKDGTVSYRRTSFRLNALKVSRLLEKSKYAVVFMATIGPILEEEVKRLMDSGNMTQGVMLDAVGSETADAFADWMHRQYIKKKAEDAGYRITPRFSPGYGDWPITVQKEVLDVCDGGEIGIRVTDSFLMVPRKSVSAVFGLVEK